MTKRFKRLTGNDILKRKLWIALIVFAVTVLSVLAVHSDSSAQISFCCNQVADGTIGFCCNGTQSFNIQCIQDGVYEFRIIAREDPASSVYPVMGCQVDGNSPVQIDVASDQWQTYTFSQTLIEGSHQINISFINDTVEPQEDRNLFVSKIEMVGPAGTTQIFPVIPATTTTELPTTTAPATTTSTIQPTTSTIQPTTSTIQPTTSTIRPTTTTIRPTTTAPATTTSTIQPTTSTIRPTTTTIRPTTSSTTSTAAPTNIDVSLGWSPNSEPDIGGYVIYYGLSSRNYTFNKDVGNNTSGTITGLKVGQSYYIALKAYNTSGLYSDYSVELVYSSGGAVSTTTIAAGGTTTIAAGGTTTIAAGGTTTIAAGGGGGGGGGGFYFFSTTTTTIQVKTTSTTSTIPECLNDSKCDDGSFCNGKETCVNGICVSGQRPCGEDQACNDDVDECWDTVKLTASFLPATTVRRPFLFPQRCTWLLLVSAGKNNFNENSTIYFSGPSGEAAGVEVNPDRKPFVLGNFIFLPVCIEKDAVAGEIVLTIKSEVHTSNTTVEETIETSFMVE
jgi:hypothetical protein